MCHTHQEWRTVLGHRNATLLMAAEAVTHAQDKLRSVPSTSWLLKAMHELFCTYFGYNVNIS